MLYEVITEGSSGKKFTGNFSRTIPMGSQPEPSVITSYSIHYTKLYELAGELNTTGAVAVPTGGGTVEDRVAALEAEISRLTAKTEELRNNVV